jgi:hypothetical protein
MRCIQPSDFSAAQKISAECRLYLHVSSCVGLAVRPDVRRVYIFFGVSRGQARPAR